MFLKSVSSLSLVLILSILHTACCLIPLLAVTANSVAYFSELIQYKPVFTILQIFAVAYIGIRLLKYHRGSISLHSRLSKFALHVSFVIALASLLIGYYEPFKTENQVIAEQQFQFFRAHRQLALDISGNYNASELKEDISGMEGVKPNTVKINHATISLTFQSSKTTKSRILQRLAEKGYQVTERE